VRIVSHRRQRTLARPAEVAGTGFVTGAAVRLRFLPAPPSSGVVFVRTDLRPEVVIPAHVGQVSGTARRTTLGQPPAAVGLVEHVLAALAGLRVDNCRVELDAPEPPGVDGSAGAFVDALRTAGVVLQADERPVWATDEPVRVARRGATVTLYPDDRETLRVSYLLDYGPASPIGRQSHTTAVTPSEFAARLARCRTFLLAAEADELRRQGLGRNTTTADLVVFGPHGVVDNALRFADEPARHKALDVVGDLALLGADLCGHVVAYRSGHELNVELARVLWTRLAAARPPAPPPRPLAA
jgi:UDP-3-O-acyl N-acetylglucosamine deacetylase